MVVSLQDTLEQLRSERVKDRQNALANLDQIFADPANVANLDPRGDGKPWLKTFQSLFACVVIERATCLKKGSIASAQPIALSRLRDAAYALRQLVERSVRHLNRRAIKAILSHIVQMFVHNGAVFQPVSMSYLKALSTILQFPPHVDHLEVDEWSMVAQLCSNVVLGDDPDTPLAQHTPPAQPTNRPLGLEDVEHMVCLHHLVASPTAPLRGDDSCGLSLLDRYAAFLERHPVETSSHLPALAGLNRLLRELELNEALDVIRFSSRASRTLLALWHTKNRQLKEQLVICWRILVPVVSSCLSPTYECPAAEKATLPAVQDDARMTLVDLHRSILREHESRSGSRPITLTSLRLKPSEPADRRRPYELLTLRQGAAFSESDALAWAILELNATALIGLLPPPPEQLQLQLRRSAATQDPSSREPSVVHDTDELPPTTATQSPTKRRRTTPDAPSSTKRRRAGTGVVLSKTGSALIGALLSDLRRSTSLRTGSKGQDSLLWQLQLVLFVIDRWPELDAAVRRGLTETVLGLASNADAVIQSWAFVCLAEVARHCPADRQPEESHDQASDDTTVAAGVDAALAQAWTLACRRLPSAPVTRPAAHLLSTLLRSSRMPEATVLADLRSILAEIHALGPSVLCDSSSDFLVAALDRASRDAQLFSLNLRPKVLDWLLVIWRTGVVLAMRHVPPRSSDLEWTDLLALLSACVDHAAPGLAYSAFNAHTRHTDLTASIADEKELDSLRNFLLFQRVQSDRRPSGSTTSPLPDEAKVTPPGDASGESTPQLSPMNTEQRRICNALERGVLSANALLMPSGADAAASMMPSASSEKSLAKSLEPEQAATLLDLALLALAFHAVLAERRIAALGAMASAAAKLLNHTVNLVLGRHDWTPAERLSVLQALAPLLPLPLADSASPTSSDVLLVQPGPRAGVRNAGSSKKRSAQMPALSAAAKQALATGFWRTLLSAQGLKPLLESLYNSVHHDLTDGTVDASQPASLNASLSRGESSGGDVRATIDDDDNDDDFIGTARMASHDTSRSQREQGAAKGYSQDLIALCVAALVQAPKLAAGSDEPTQDERLVNLMFEGSLDSLVKLGPSLVAAVSNGCLWLTLRDVIDLLDQIGSDLLTSYHFARDQRARCLAIDLVSATMPMWLGGKRLTTELLDKLRKLCVFFTEQVTKQKWRSPWKTRRRAAEFIADYIQADPQERLWINDDEELISRCPPSEAALHLNCDADVRVRASGATITAGLFDHLDRDDDGFAALYEKLKERLPLDHAKRENVATRVLCLSNVTISSSSLRNVSLFHLLEIFLATGSLEPTLRRAFEEIAARLGFAGPRQLFKCFAGQITWGMVGNSYDPLKVPYKILGFRSRKECIEQTFRESGAMLLASDQGSGRDYFATMARTARKTVKEGIRECLPFLAASELGFAAEEAQGAPTSSRAALWARVLDTIKQWDPDVGADVDAAQMLQLVTSIADQVVTALLAMFYEPASSTAFPESLRIKDEATHRNLIFIAPTIGSQDRRIAAHEPNRPFFAATTVHEAILVLAESGVDPTGTEVAYHVLRQTFFRIGNAPFVNDQRRYVQAVQLYVAMCAEGVSSSPRLLDVLLQGIGFLVDQPSVHEAALSLASWAISACAKQDWLQARVASILTEFARTAAFGPDEGPAEIMDTARATSSTCRWAETTIAALPPASEAVRLALHMWPNEIPPQLKSLAPADARPRDIAAALQRCPDVRVTAAVLNRLRVSLKAASAEERQAFARSTVWLLFERLRLDELQGQRIDELAQMGQALSEMLNICEGRLQTPGLGAMQSLPSSEVHAALESTMSLKNPSRALQAVTIFIVLQHLRGRSITPAEQAYVALRGILSLAKTLTAALPKWPNQAYEELTFLAAFEAPEPSAPTRSARELEDPTLVASATAFEVWIRKITGIISHMLIKSSTSTFFHHIQGLVEGEAEIASRVLPVLLQLCTADESCEGGDEVIRHLDASREAIARHFREVLTSDGSDPRAWSAIIEGLLHVRRWSVLESDPTYSDLWFDIDFLLLARRGLDCKMYTAALLFVELYFEHSTDASDAEAKQGAISSLLYDAYSNVEDPDGFYGVVNADIQESLTRRLHHEGEWHRALQLHAAAYEASATLLKSAGKGIGQLVAKDFHMLGFNRLASMLQGPATPASSAPVLGAAGPQYGGFQYDMAWRMGSWDLPCSDPYVAGTSRGTYAALKALHRDRSGASIDRAVAGGFARELEGLAGAKPEAINDVRKVQLDLLSLHEVREWRQLASQLGAEEAVAHLTAFWAEPRPTFHIECHERVLSVRQSILQAERTRGQLHEIGNLLSPAAEESMRLERSMMICLSAAARKQGRIQVSINATSEAQRLQAALSDKSNLTDEEFASVLWAQGEHAFALESLGAIIEAFQVGEKSAVRSRYRKAVLMARLGEWRATARSQQPRAIDTTLFKPALELMVAQSSGHAQSTEEQAKVAYKWAKFADEQYRGVDAEEIERLKVYIDRRKEEIRQNQVESDRTVSRSLKQRLMQFQRQAEKILRQDENHLKELESARTLFLQRAIAMYSRSLTMSDRYDDAVGRLTSLWFDNAFDENANRPLSATLPQIPSHKFIPLTHQLSARLSTAKGSAGKGLSTFQTNLSDLVLRVCRDHPFHTLYALFALLKAGKDAKASERRDVSASQGAESSQRQRSMAAESIWVRVRTTDRLRRRLQVFDEVCQAYVEWAEVNLAQQFSRYFTPNGAIKRGPLRMPPASELRLVRLRDVDVPVATAEVPIDRSCEYRDIVSIVRYSETFTTAGGIHLPKINECIGSDGKRYKQLFKRDDDLRQDAVMQQVFRLVNGLLDRDRKASQRRLTVRTYAVIPLGPQCGLLEFVTNTVPIGEVLIRMHGQYGPKDMSPMEARTRIREAQGLTASQKLEVFLDVCERMPPAFRFFFTERQKDPPSWFAMRLNYTRSAATTSIVGHILGLGDRHVSNILLDKQSGELVHIDFGVAFDQGKLLPIPELVPFRLTRDLVDGMGLSGIEGTYRRCCEETLRVLRDGRDVVKTVLEVFKHDPLFVWTSNPIKVLKAQGAAGGGGDDDDDETNGGGGDESAVGMGARGRGRRSDHGRGAAPSVEPTPPPPPNPSATSLMTIDTAELSADRAITSVMTKLSSSLSVEYTVNELIQQAMDAGNLSAIFQGWQAAL